MTLLAIDPGSIVSGYTIVDIDTYKIIDKGIIENNQIHTLKADHVVIERFQSYGMAVGLSVMIAIWWAGRFYEHFGENTDRIFRKDIKLNICGVTRAKDTNIRHALIERFAKHDLKRGTGTKANPDWFYGFKKDIWAAYAIAVTWIDNKNGKIKLDI